MVFMLYIQWENMKDDAHKLHVQAEVNKRSGGDSVQHTFSWFWKWTVFLMPFMSYVEEYLSLLTFS